MMDAKSRYSNGRIARHITCTSEVEERTMRLSPPSSCAVHPLFIHYLSTVHCTVVLFIHYSPARKQCKSRAACRTYWPCSKKVPGSSRTPGKPQGIPGTLARQARTATALAHMDRARSGSTCGVAPPIGHRIHTKGNKNEPSPSPL